MPAENEPTYFFMHIMKTAGTTFAQHVNANFAHEQIYPLPGDPDHAIQYWQVDEIRALDPPRRAEIRVYCGHFPYAVGDLVGADITMTILREPVERTLSALRHCRRQFPQHKGKPLEAIYEDSWHGPGLFRNYQVKQFAMTGADPLRGHIDDIVVDEARFATAVRQLEQVDLFGLTDEYGAFVDSVRERFGWRIHEAKDLQVAPPHSDAPESLRRRIETENAADVAFYEHALSLRARRRAVS